jgi:replicative DNA helicase
LQRRRELLVALKKTSFEIEGQPNVATSQHLENLQLSLSALQNSSGIEIKRVSDLKETKIDQWRNAKNKGYVGVPSGFFELNKYLGGWRGSLGIIGGYRGCGKSTLIRQEALCQAQDGYRVAIFTLEDPIDIASACIVGNHKAVSVFHLDIGESSPEKIASMETGFDELKELPLYLIGNAYTLEQIIATTNLLKERYGLDIVYIDHVQCIQPLQLPQMNRNNTMAVYSNRLAAFSKQLNIPVVLASQLSRDCEKESRTPKLSDLRDSGTLEADARQVLLLYAVEANNAETFKLKVAKNNYGVSGVEIDLNRIGGKQRFEPVDGFKDELQ